MQRQLGLENVLKNNRKVYDKITIFKWVMSCLFIILYCSLKYLMNDVIKIFT